MAENKKIICSLCNIELQPQKTYFEYLGHNFSTDILRCPKCGNAYIPEELVKGRMTEVESQLEDK